MFGFLFRRAQATVDNAIGMAVTRALVATPFLIAAAFAVSALSVYLQRIYEPELVYLMLAGLFAVVGLVALLVARVRSPQQASTPSEPAVEPAAEADADPLKLNPEDRDVLVALLTSAAPVALPGLMKLVWRNLPVVIALIAGASALILAGENAENCSERSDDPVVGNPANEFEPPREAEPAKAA